MNGYHEAFAAYIIKTDLLYIQQENNESRITDVAENNTIHNPGGSRLVEATCEDNMKVKENIRQYKCKFCEYKGKNKHSLVCHFRRMHDENKELFPCDLCEYKSKYKYLLERHKNMVHRDIFPWYHCQFCNLKTKRELSLQKHIKFRHSKDSEQLHCHLCGRTFKTKSTLRRHIKHKHSRTALVYQCFHCEYTSKIKYNLRDHICYKHNKNIEVLKCHHCEYRSKFKSQLKKHISQTHNEKADLQQCRPHISDNESNFDKSVIYTRDCEFCDFKAKDEPSLWKHIKSRHKEVIELHQCCFCDQRCRTKYALKRHINCKHNESGICYQYPYCEYTTKIENVLPGHINIRHNKNAVLYRCSHCEYKSKSKHHLKDHINNIHNQNIEWHRCKLCYFRTKSKYGLRKHFKRKHNGKVSTIDGSSNEHSQQTPLHSNCTSSKLMNVKDHKNIGNESNNDGIKNVTRDDQLGNENIISYLCSHCEYKSKSEDNLKDHINTIHQNATEVKDGLRQNVEKIDDRKISTIKENIENKCDNHVNVNMTADNRLDNDNTLLHLCFHCEYKCESEDNLKDHIKHIHINEKVEWYQCQFCYFTTKFKYGLRQHLGKKHKRNINAINHNTRQLQQSTLNSNSTSSNLMNVKGEEDIKNEYDENVNRIIDNQFQQKIDVLDYFKHEIDENDLSTDMKEIETEDSSKKLLLGITNQETN